MASSWLLALLQLLLLLGMLLSQLLRLLLVLLFHLLLPRLIGRRLRDPLMVLLLPGLEFLAIIDLAYLELLLLLLVLLVLPGVTRVWRGNVFDRRKVPCMHYGAWTSGLSDRARSFVIRASCCFVGWAITHIIRTSIVVRCGGRGMNGSTLSGGYCAAVSESAGPAGSSDGRLAVIGGGAQLGV